MVLLLLLALFIGIPAVEIATFIRVGAAVGVFNTVAFTFLTAFLGIVLVRWQGFRALEELRLAMDEGRPPVLEIVSGALLLLAGILLLVPGFVTDAAGFLLLVPPVRRLLASLILSRLVAKADVRVRETPAGTVIEAEVVEIVEEPGRIEHRDSPWKDK